MDAIANNRLFSHDRYISSGGKKRERERER